ncbi:MAG: HRDC domain-containing protein [Trueperaceae bacterium]|nr:HRDC domain-containing protein [Trueperaceae bacterium]
MTQERTVGTLLVGIGVLALAINLSGAWGWLWPLFLGGAALGAYLRRREVWLVTTGSVLVGVTIGLWTGTLAGFLVSVGIGFWVVDRLEPSPSRWPLLPAAGLVSLGLLLAVAQSGVLASVWFPVLLILFGLGLWLLTSGDSDWVTAPPLAAERTTERGERAGDEADVAARRERLERWRRTVAATDNVAPVRILSDDALARVAERQPRTLNDLAAVRGVGPRLVERYGTAILAALRGEAGR